MAYRPMDACDGALVELARFFARRSSRRGFLGRLGAMLVGGFALPLLPVDRRGAGVAQASEFAKKAQTEDEAKCNYWRYCSLGGTLCSCCGGTASSCPPGSIAPPTGWVGSCVNPDDGETYLIVYRDCCGKEICHRCWCGSAEGMTPVYRPQSADAIIWCIGTDQMTYHCTHAALIGKA